MLINWILIPPFGGSSPPAPARQFGLYRVTCECRSKPRGTAAWAPLIKAAYPDPTAPCAELVPAIVGRIRSTLLWRRGLLPAKPSGRIPSPCLDSAERCSSCGRPLIFKGFQHVSMPHPAHQLSARRRDRRRSRSPPP